jgi:hypothetical protein
VNGRRHARASVAHYFVTVVSFVLGAAIVTSIASSATTARPPVKHDLAKLKSIVLSQADVPDDFSVVLGRAYTPAQIAIQKTWTLAELKAWGYEGGYEVQFDRSLSSDNPAQISSDAGAYKTVAGAKDALSANAAACQQGLWSELPLTETLGNAAHLCTLSTAVRGYPAQVFFVVWRYGRFKAAVTLTGLNGAVDASQVLALARIQQAHLRRVA